MDDIPEYTCEVFETVGCVVTSMTMLIIGIVFMGTEVLPYTVSKNGSMINETKWISPEVMAGWLRNLIFSSVCAIICVFFGTVFITIVIFLYTRPRPYGKLDVAYEKRRTWMWSSRTIYSIMLVLTWIGILACGIAIIGELAIDNATLADMIGPTMNVTEISDWSVHIEQGIGYTYIYVAVALLLISIICNWHLSSNCMVQCVVNRERMESDP